VLPQRKGNATKKNPIRRWRDELAEIESNMDGPPFLVPLLIDGHKFVDAQVDSGCECYAAMSEKFAQQLGLEQVRLARPRNLGTVLGRTVTQIRDIARCELDINGWSRMTSFYIIPGMPRDMILGLPWMRMNQVVLDPAEGELRIGVAEGLRVRESHTRPRTQKLGVVAGSVVVAACRRQKRRPADAYEFASTSLREITRILQATAPKTDPTPVQTLLPKELSDFADLFDKEKAAGLPPHRGQTD